MIYVVLFVLGLCLGSFINALVWRLRQQLDDDGNLRKGIGYGVKGKGANSSNVQRPTSNVYSVVNGRSMCPNCKHTLAWYDLLPVASWLSLGGKCRYCKKPISWQYPLIELLTGALFVVSYAVWPLNLGITWVLFGFVSWLFCLVGLIALAIYDSRWMLLPNRIVLPLIVVATVSLVLQFVAGRPLSDVWQVAMACLVAGGIFWVLYQISGGKWIGGGDVKLGLLAGLLFYTPTQAFLFLFVASLLGLAWSLPLMAAKKLTRTSKVPFGPFLIASAIIVVLWGASITSWYSSTFLTI